MRTNKISIIMTVKNETKFLINVLDLMYKQKPDQLIIVDGGSSDDHIGLYKTLQKKYKFELVVNDLEPKSLYDSPFGAFIKGLPLAKHEYVSLWSVDDEPYPDYLSTMKKAIANYKADLYICSADVARENKLYCRTLYPFDAYVSPECMVKNYKTFARRINMVNCVIRKSKIEENVKWLTKANFDNTYFFNIAFDTGLINIGKPLILYRSYFNSHGQTGKWKNINKWIDVSKKRFATKPEVFARAMKAGMWDNMFRNWVLLQLFSKLPYFLRSKAYDKIYSYDSKEEK